MCFGGSPKAPQIVYQGPSQADIDANKAQIDLYRQQMTSQQDSFSKQLQSQIDSANQMTAAKQNELQKQLADAAAATAAQQTTAYAVTATQSEDTQGAQTTTATTAKQKPKSSLKITPGGAAPASAGTGLNIGV